MTGRKFHALTQPPSARQAGFTLVEMTVAVTLLALLALLCVPLFGTTGTNKLDYAARRLGGTFKYLFNEAALTGLEHRLVFNLDRNSYRGRVVGAGGEIADLEKPGGETRLDDHLRIRDLQLTGRGTFTAGEVTISIHPAGWVEENSIHLESDAGEQLTLRIMPLTGVGEILDGYQEL